MVNQVISKVTQLTEQQPDGEERESSFRTVFQRFYRPLFRFFEKRGFSAEESHDLTQETFIRVYKGMDGFRGEAPFEAWLFQIAANMYRNALRQQGAKKRSGHVLSLVETSGENSKGEIKSGLVAEESSHSPLEGVLREERVRVLRGAVDSLPEQMRKSVMLRVYQDLSYQEIAVVMRISVDTVKAHLHQARRQLREKIAAHYDKTNL